MANIELVDQITELLQYLSDNEDLQKSDKQAFEIAQNIHNAVHIALFEEKENPTCAKLKTVLDRRPFSIPEFTSAAYGCLSEYCLGNLRLYEGSDIQTQFENRDLQISNLNKILGFKDTALSLYHNKYANNSNTVFTGKGVVYSVITGGYDKIIEPLDTESRLDHYLLTDSAPDNYNGRWQIKVMENKDNLSPKAFSRWLKMHPQALFPDYDYSIYVDGKITILSPLESFVQTYAKESGMICFPHYESTSLEEECEAILSNDKAKRDEIQAQLNKYKSMGYNGKGYLTDNACLVRSHHDEKLNQVMEDWWAEYKSYSHGRDQMSFDYACWQNSYDYDICDLFIYSNPWITTKTLH